MHAISQWNVILVHDDLTTREVLGRDVLQRVVARLLLRRLLPDRGFEVAAAKVGLPDGLHNVVEQRAAHEDAHGRLRLALGVQQVAELDVLDLRAVPLQRDKVELSGSPSPS